MVQESVSMSTPTRQSGTSRFEQLLVNNPPVLSSLVAQLPTESILHLYQTSKYLRSFLADSPTSWRYVSWRLYQPAQIQTPPNVLAGNPQTRPGSYALDKLLLYTLSPISTRLTSLVLDNTAVSGATLFTTVMVKCKDTLEHVSVRGCKNVSLKYHINPWLNMYALALAEPAEIVPPDMRNLALKSLYTYRCRHHRRRPYLPSSLSRKESDSEPTHELVLTCHRLGIWTDTAWCTTPGARCYRRRGYVTMRVPQDPREVWVVYDRLWRSRNWLGPPPGNRDSTSKPRKRKRDGRVWEEEEDAINGEPVGLGVEGKDVPVHLRQTHRRFVENIHCDNCAEEILERCEQCSVMMHCTGCRKTLCASCAFDRPYLRNQNATEEEKKRFWWAPGCAVSPCSMQDIDPAAPGAPNQPNSLPNIKFKWCCTEPIFSGGGGITLGQVGQSHDTDKLRAAPLAAGQGYEDTEFAAHGDCEVPDSMGSPLSRTTASGPGGRWASLAEMFRYGAQMSLNEDPDSVPRVLCDECYSSEQWKIKCKACSVALCLKHDVKEKQRVRICGYKDLNVEKQELIARLKATKLFKTLWLRRKQLKQQQEISKANKNDPRSIMAEAQLALAANVLLEDPVAAANQESPAQNTPGSSSRDRQLLAGLPIRVAEPASSSTDAEPIGRPLSPGSNSTGPLSRASSPAPSARSISAPPEPRNTSQKGGQEQIAPSTWRGCQAFFCSATRPAGDHRRRCSAVMRQCHDCKVYVCDDCVVGLDKPCPCSECRLPDAETDPITGGTAAFFCPNCRHGRIVTRKCRRRPAYLNKNLTQPSVERKLKQKMSHQEKLNHVSNIFLEESNITTFGEAEFTLDEFYGSIDHELQELQEISISAVNVVKKVQNLRSQAPPGSPAALALPNIIIEGIDAPPTSSGANQQ